MIAYQKMPGVHVDVTPSSSTHISCPHNTEYIVSLGLGDLEIVDHRDTAIVYGSVPSGTIIPIRAKEIGGTDNTTVTQVIAISGGAANN